MAKQTIHFVVDEDVFNNLRDVYIAASLEGVDFMTKPRRFKNGVLWEPRMSRSAVLREAVRRGAEACRRAALPVAPALPERAGSADADRLRAAMGAMTPIEACRAAGLKDSASIRNVTNKGAALAGKLLAWVEGREASK